MPVSTSSKALYVHVHVDSIHVKKKPGTYSLKEISQLGHRYLVSKSLIKILEENITFTNLLYAFPCQPGDITMSTELIHISFTIILCLSDSPHDFVSD